MTTKPHTITEEILKEFNEKFRNERWYPNNWEPIETFIAQTLARKDEEWKKKVRGLRMEKMVCKDCGNDEFEWDCDTVECIKCKGIATDYNAIGMNQTIDKFNKKVDELLK